jgi:hypothetical protein
MPIRFGSYKLQNYRPIGKLPQEHQTGRLTFRFFFAYYAIEADTALS